ncbi:biotin-dependent carboxyltransferase family protein [Lunatimonas salinarum]|uniref:5-oxoprolinase subunit C family protein n=1 Tax=Lunatimonas salinarum TaxID=1774590 RepID=UPI001ADED2A3|nr:biotin-dependent carboxyltransferase family protein [Lunatimonas salinarum]
MHKSLGFLKFRDIGIQVSMQDSGRIGYAEYGIPESGFMDAVSAGRSNLLVGNPPGQACLELFQGMASIEVSSACQVVFSGASAQIRVNSVPYPLHQVITLKAGDVIQISAAVAGNWLYMALAGIWDQRDYFGSKSFYKAIGGKAGFAVNDRVGFYARSPHIQRSNARLNPSIFWSHPEIAAYAGPDFHLLDQNLIARLLNTSFQISNSINRMGYQLEGTILHKLPEILSAPVYPGTVQLTPSGRLIVLMKDAQVTGGYPRVLQLTPRGLAEFSQKRPGEKIKFRLH